MEEKLFSIINDLRKIIALDESIGYKSSRAVGVLIAFMDDPDINVNYAYKNMLELVLGLETYDSPDPERDWRDFNRYFDDLYKEVNRNNLSSLRSVKHWREG